MRRRCFLLSAVFLASISADAPRAAGEPRGGGDLVINEIYCDHPGADGGFEFVELYNPGAAEAGCAGFSLELVDGATGAARTLWTAPAGIAIAPGAFLLIGGSEYPSEPGCALAGRIENGPDAVRLCLGGSTIDCVAYGEWPAAPCEGRPAPAPGPGRSLSRRPDGFDSGDNAADLVAAVPTPGRRNFHPRDCALACGSGSLLLCRNLPFGIPLSITSVGLERLAAEALVRARWSGEAPGGCESSMTISLDLEPGESVDLSLGPGSPPGGGGTCVAVLELPGDGDPRNDTATVDVSLSPGPVVISEIMYRPGGGEGEWIELLCREPASVDLSGWSLRDRAGGRGVVPDGVGIGPGGHLIAAQDPAGFAASRPECAAPVTGTGPGWPRLNDTGEGGPADVVSLLDRSGRLVDMVAYEGLCGDEQGRSIERISPDACGAGGEGIVQRSLDPRGATPGEVNSVDSRIVPGAGLLAEPNPFGPALHGAVRITAEIRAEEEAFSASIYDIDGVLVRTLAAGRSGAPVVSFLWDGLDDRGRPAPVGLYVCVAEFVMRGGGVCRRERCALVVGGW